MATFTYDGSGSRKKMQVKRSATTILQRYYLGDRYEADVASGVTKQRFYIGGDAYSAPAVYVNQGSSWILYYICRDYLGSITQITSDSGSTTTEELSFDAWGRMRNPNTLVPYAPDTEPSLFLGRGYTGHEYLPWFGLVNMNARLYDPAVGRFLSPDPYVQMADFSQNYNRYSYALNNPLKYTDEDGEWVHIAIGGLIGGVANLIANWNKAEGFWDKLAAFGVGAGAGATTVATAGASFWAAAGAAAATGASVAGTNNVIAQTGKNFSGFNQVDWEQVGLYSFAGSVSGFGGSLGAHFGGQYLGPVIINGTNITSPVFQEAIKQSVGGMMGGYISGYATGLILTGDYGKAMGMGLHGLAYGGTAGLISGGITGFNNAKSAGKDPWTGRSIVKLDSPELFFDGARYSNKVLNQMNNSNDVYHAFPEAIDGFASTFGEISTKIGADGKTYQWLKMPGNYGGKTGVFEYIKGSDGVINHRFFNVKP
ncbi:RHS repeat-associated protein [Parabacteroides sp. PFB2-12]|uniref:RHS repeat-associated core domain-containing protein n=1 Tax=unclassified Parabacteroides TaxID=2649774 RepID=UPI002474F6C3|nr:MULTISPECIES: RHS repeat-associated core domain-containing protein [unclassified Parabacteroides]MDH6344166.1 RHS repeat-associated protein [Parabacteroides sp. PM6-13]MDH6392073.1 RHS repeat-associated protein [Parabacteroides sp. PFB2-12]